MLDVVVVHDTEALLLSPASSLHLQPQFFELVIAHVLILEEVYAGVPATEQLVAW